MRAKEFIVEMATVDSVEENRNTIIDKGIGQALRDKGYKKIGHGVDQDAYIEPGTGQVLKIFGTGRWKTSGFSDDHKMFFKWYKYCMKHADNPYLPKFSGYETFEFKGKTYLQIRQERLTRDTKFASELSAYGRPFIGDSSPSNTVPPELVMTVLKSMVEKGGYKMKGWSDYENRGFTPGVAGGFERIIQRLGIDGFYKWIITCKELRHTARMNWWHYDLESWNIMMRGQTPVILDPWYAGDTI